MKSSQSLYLAIDQSTSATKVMIFTSQGSLLDSSALEHRQIYPCPGWVEHDAEEIYTNTIQAASILLQRHPDAVADLAVVSLTNQRETFVLFDRQTGKPLYNAIVWQCRRGDDVCRQLLSEGKGELVHERTGLKLDTYFPASKLRWLLDERPDLEQRLKDGSALFGTIDTYLVYRLTGGRVYATDHTNASRTLFYDIERLDWSPELCDVFGLKLAALPQVRESSALYGDTDLGGVIDRRLPICGVMGDSQAAFFAQRCFTTGSAKVTFGTGSSILLNIGSHARRLERGALTALGWVWQGVPTYACEGILNYTGATVSWLRDQLKLIETPSETESLATSVTDTGGVYFVPAFVGLSAPYWRSDARAAILGMSPSTTRAHVARAALEAIAYMINDALAEMSENSGIQICAIQADGGAVRNAFLMQFVADITRRVVRAAQVPELSALGAVFSGMLGMGMLASLDELGRLPYQYSEYHPIMSSDQAEKLHIGWRRAVSQILS